MTPEQPPDQATKSLALPPAATPIHDWQSIVTGDGSTTIRHPDHSETYHSTFGAITESNYVFLNNSGVLERLQSGKSTSVLEIGFGTGLNFLLTAAAAHEHLCPLHYVSIENDPLPAEVLSNILSANFPNQRYLIEKTIDAVDQTTRSFWPEVNITDEILLKLILDDALTTNLGKTRYHAIFLDAFSPKNNPELWSASFLSKLHQTIFGNGVLVSYCVNRRFRDGLTEAGFKWRKVPGPPGKREVLIATA